MPSLALSLPIPLLVHCISQDHGRNLHRFLQGENDSSFRTHTGDLLIVQLCLVKTAV